jgi:hypothetical protein
VSVISTKNGVENAMSVQVPSEGGTYCRCCESKNPTTTIVGYDQEEMVINPKHQTERVKVKLVLCDRCYWSVYSD